MSCQIKETFIVVALIIRTKKVCDDRSIQRALVLS